MTNYDVVPKKNNDRWKVEKNGRTVSSNHRTQQTAINAARRQADVGDDVRIHTPDGTIRDEFTVRGA